MFFLSYKKTTRKIICVKFIKRSIIFFIRVQCFVKSKMMMLMMFSLVVDLKFKKSINCKLQQQIALILLLTVLFIKIDQLNLKIRINGYFF